MKLNDKMGKNIPYARKIIFTEKDTAINPFETISKINSGVEQKRELKISRLGLSRCFVYAH